MAIEAIYRHVSPRFRKGRLQWFARMHSPVQRTTILDAGGCPLYWKHSSIAADITVVNLPSYKPPADALGCKLLHGDCTAMPFPDRHFDIAHSNSVIEHVASW